MIRFASSMVMVMGGGGFGAWLKNYCYGGIMTTIKLTAVESRLS